MEKTASFLRLPAMIAPHKRSLSLPRLCQSARVRQGRSLPTLRIVQLHALRVTRGQPVTTELVRFGISAGIEAAIGADSLPKVHVMTTAYADKIRELNDAFRKTLAGGQSCFTASVFALGTYFTAAALAAVRTFDAFTPDNDPYGEHDFGAITIGEQKLFWKIDYYDLSLQYGSKNPSDPAQTTRVMTIMLAEEY